MIGGKILNKTTGQSKKVKDVNKISEEPEKRYDKYYVVFN